MIVNKKIFYDFNVIKEITCGIKLVGTEVKPLKNGNGAIEQAYCYIKNNELYIKNMFISEYKCAKHFNHNTTRDRKLLLKKQEILKLKEELKLNKGLTILPIKVFEINNFIKINIGLCSAKKKFEKRLKIKEKQLTKEIKEHGK